MPHIVFDQYLDLKKFYDNFILIENFEIPIIKITNVFFDKFQKSLLIPVIVIDSHKQHFLIEVLAKNNKTTIRLYPNTDPIKTDAVKISIAIVGSIVQKLFPESKISKTNVGDFLLHPVTQGLV